MVQHFIVNNRSRSFIGLFLCLKIILIIRFLRDIFVFFFLTGVFINLIYSFLLIRKEGGSNEAVVLEVWVQSFCHSWG